MGWFRRSKLAFESFRNPHDITCMITPNIDNPIQNPHQLFHASTTPSSSSSISHLNPLIRFGRDKLSPFLFGASRNNYSRHTHFCPRWLKNPRTIYSMIVVGAGLAATVCFGNLETVPYTNRTHLVLLPHDIEKEIGEEYFMELKEETFKEKILPENHPESVRVSLIAKNIISSLYRGLSKDNVSIDLRDSSDSPNPDDKRVKRGKEKRMETAREHIESFNWEILVVDKPIENAFCMPGGKIVVFTGLLDLFKSDDELATVLGHEVAHALGRHVAEGASKTLWTFIGQLFAYQFVMPDLAHAMSVLFLKLPFSRKMEMEADYIGLLLMASAGYDPRVAPGVYNRFDEMSGGSSKMDDYLCTHPSGKKRAMLLAQSKVMEKALLLYKHGRTSKRAVEGSFHSKK